MIKDTGVNIKLDMDEVNNHCREDIEKIVKDTGVNIKLDMDEVSNHLTSCVLFC